MEPNHNRFVSVGSLYNEQMPGVGYVKTQDKDTFSYAFAWKAADAWATLVGACTLSALGGAYLNEVLQQEGFFSESNRPDYLPLSDFQETAGENWQLPLLKVVLREQLGSRYLAANHYQDASRAYAELDTFVHQTADGQSLPMADFMLLEDTRPLRALVIPVDALPRTVFLTEQEGSTLKSLQGIVGGRIEPFDVLFGDGISLYVHEEGLFSCQPNRAIYATKEMEAIGYLSQMDYQTPVKEGDLYTLLYGNIVAVGFDEKSGKNRSLTDAEFTRVASYFSSASRPGSAACEILRIRSAHRETPPYDIASETRGAQNMEPQPGMVQESILPDAER